MQGAATAIEYAAILERCLEDVDAADWPQALQRYEQVRWPCAARIQFVESQQAQLDASRSGCAEQRCEGKGRSLLGVRL